LPLHSSISSFMTRYELCSQNQILSARQPCWRRRYCPEFGFPFILYKLMGAENAGRENDGPSSEA